MAKIENVDVYGLTLSIYRSGYPMMREPPTKEDFKDANLEIFEAVSDKDYENSHIKRAIKLAQAKGGGHDQFLTGIHVDFDLTFSNKAWVEAERYTFLNFISSMSTMHRISVLPIGEMCNEYVIKGEVAIAEQLQREYNEIDGDKEPEKKKEAYLRLLYNTPSGFELMAGMTTNYRCLKNIYHQRRHHRLPCWQIFCDWVETLPMAKELIMCE